MNDIKELLYDIQKEKTVEKQAELIQIYVDNEMDENLFKQINQGCHDHILQQAQSYQEDLTNADGLISELEGRLDKGFTDAKGAKSTIQELERKLERSIEEVKDAHGYVGELEGDLERAERDYFTLAERNFIYVISSKNLEHYTVAYGDSSDAIMYADGHFRTQSKYDISFDESWLKTTILEDDNGTLLEKIYYKTMPEGKDELIGSIRRIRLDW